MSPEDAVEIGYEVGRNLRLAVAGKALEKRSLRRWLGEKVDNPAFVFWSAATGVCRNRSDTAHC
jgi:hypothetical protein